MKEEISKHPAEQFERMDACIVKTYNSLLILAKAI